MPSNQPMSKKVVKDTEHVLVSALTKLGPLLAICLLTLMAAIVFCFSALAALPTCWQQPVQAGLLELAGGNNAGPQLRFLKQNNTQDHGWLELYQPQGVIPYATLNNWPLPGNSGPAAPFYISPLPLDSNYDGFIDQLISTDINGRIWLTEISAAGFGTTLLLADLTSGNWRFISSGGLVDVSLPMPMPPNGVAGRHKLLLLVARNVKTGEDALVSLRLPAVIAQPAMVQFTELIDRSILSQSELNGGLNPQQWLTLLNAAGWWVRLSGQLTQPPRVIGGVIYSAVATSDFNAVTCASQSADHSLVAMHLHSAGLVYNKRRFQIATGEGHLKLQQQANGSAALILADAANQQTVLTELLMISPACPDCTEPLQLDQFPRWLKLATYRQETGAH